MAYLLIIDDDPAFRSSLSEMLTDLGHQVREASHVEAGLQSLRSEPVDLVITDLKLAGEDGLAFLRQAQHIKAVPCIMLTAYASGSNTIEAMRLGAFDHLTKPVSRQVLLQTLQRALPERTVALATEQRLPQESLGTEPLIGNSECMRQVFKQIGLAAATEATVLILGETGTGKEEVARALHRNSLRANGPFVAVNCAAIPPDLMESELFGHVKGAFTGAVADRQGYLRQAAGGTLFLDEIGDMPLALQAKILRVLEAREFSPVGTAKMLALDARIIAATHRDLPGAVREGQFREDLWYRLQVMPISLPPLRERGADLLMLAQHFLTREASGRPKRLTAEAAQKLAQHDWPGNIRELRNTIARAVILSHHEHVEAAHISFTQRPQVTSIAHGLSSTSMPATSVRPVTTLAETLQQVEREMIERALRESGDNRSEAARKLGLSRQQLYRKLEEHGLL